MCTWCDYHIIIYLVLYFLNQIKEIILLVHENRDLMSKSYTSPTFSSDFDHANIVSHNHNGMVWVLCTNNNLGNIIRKLYIFFVTF